MKFAILSKKELTVLVEISFKLFFPEIKLQVSPVGLCSAEEIQRKLES